MVNKKQEKYLTEMKELPPSDPVEKKQEADLKPDVDSEPNKDTDMVESQENEKKQVIQEKREPQKSSEKSQASVPDEEPKNASEEIFEEVMEKPYTYKDIILGALNLISIICFVIIIISFPKKAKELKNLKIQEIKNETAASLETNEIELFRPKAEAIDKMFLNEAGVVNFVSDVELQEVEGGSSINVTFASQKAVIDKTGNYGVPIVIELTGSWEAIDNDLQKIDKLPYLYRPVKVEIGYDEENLDEENSGAEVVVYKYGIFLYVRESLGKTR